MEAIVIILIFALIISVILVVITKFTGIGYGSRSYNGYSLKEYFFSYHENLFFQNLLTVLHTKWGDKYLVFPKVRLADIINTENGNKGITKIWSKHVDFLIVDRTKASKMVLAIELNGPSHGSGKKSQIKSDNFKKDVFEGIGLQFKIFYNKQAGNKEEIFDGIKEFLEPIENTDFANNGGRINISHTINIPPIDQYNKSEE